MVTCTSREKKYCSLLTNGNVTIDCDNPEAYGGQGYVFGPHDFIEAAYASCMTAGARKLCEREGIPFEQVKITVALDYHDEEKMFIRHKIELIGVDKELEAKLAEQIYQNCLVKKNFLKELVFEPLEDGMETENNQGGCCCG